MGLATIGCCQRVLAVPYRSQHDGSIRFQLARRQHGISRHSIDIPILDVYSMLSVCLADYCGVLFAAGSRLT